MGKQPGRRAVRPPGGDGFEKATGDGGRIKDAAIEEDGVRPRQLSGGGGWGGGDKASGKAMVLRNVSRSLLAVN